MTKSTSGFDRIGTSFLVGTDQLAQQWQVYAGEALTEPTYNSVPEAAEYIRQEAPRLSRRIETDKKLWPWHRSRLHALRTARDEKIKSTHHENNKAHGEWQTIRQKIVGEMCALAILQGDEDLASSFFDIAVDNQGDGNIEPIGLAFAITGQADRAKSLLLQAREDPSEKRADTLLDAYRFTGDTDYREHLISTLSKRPFLISSLARHDLRHGRPVRDLLDLAKEEYGARLSLALTATRAEHDQDKSPFERYIASMLPNLAEPTKKEVSHKDHVEQTFREAGVVGGIMELATDALAGVDYDYTSEYRLFRGKFRQIIAANGHLLQGYPGYKEQGYGELHNYGAKGMLWAATARADAGDQAAAHAILSNQYPALRPEEKYRGLVKLGEYNLDDEKLLAYRNLLRTVGNRAATAAIALLPTHHRREALFHTILNSLNEGQTMRPIAAFPSVTDTYGELMAGS